MRETEYAYAVARIRAHEKNLLTDADMEQLIAAPDCDAAVRILTDKGWSEPEGESSLDICENEMNETWQFLNECVPVPELFEALVAGNDFFNLKAAIKTAFSGNTADDYMTAPSLCDTAVIKEAIEKADFRELPAFLAECADKAYHTYTEKQSGQLAEIIIDKACSRYKTELSAKAQSDLLSRITEITVAVSDIKTVRRCVSTGKSREFALDAVSGCGKLNAEGLVEAAYSGKGLETFVKESGLEELSVYADSDFAELEAFCDNYVTGLASQAKYEVFGPDPAVAYYYAETAQVKNVRIILSAKASGVPSDVISQRVRKLYV